MHACDPDFLRGLRAMCDRHDLLLLVDEVQCGIGRTGDFFAFMESAIRPDAIGMAKGLGGGFPIGAVWVGEKGMDLFAPGSHGTTFGGGPLACAAALATLDIIAKEDLIANVRHCAPPWHARLETLARDFPRHVTAVRGRGYMVALVLKTEPAAFAARLREAGLLAVRAGSSALRLLPPLFAGEEHLDAAFTIIHTCLEACEG